jgi:hypothetical protein
VSLTPAYLDLRPESLVGDRSREGFDTFVLGLPFFGGFPSFGVLRALVGYGGLRAI